MCTLITFLQELSPSNDVLERRQLTLLPLYKIEKEISGGLPQPSGGRTCTPTL